MANSSTKNALVFLQSKLSATGLPTYQGQAKQGVPYPLITHNILGSTSNYSIKQSDGTWLRIDNIRSQVAIYGLTQADTLDALDLVEAQLENNFNLGVNNDTLINVDRLSTVGPRWLGKEQYYQLIAEWTLVFGGFTTTAGTIMKSGEFPIPSGVSTVNVVNAFGFVPVSITVTVNKPSPADETIMGSPVISSYTAFGFTVELSAQTDKAGYTCSYVVGN